MAPWFMPAMPDIPPAGLAAAGGAAGLGATAGGAAGLGATAAGAYH
jgi:hypothetical protein